MTETVGDGPRFGPENLFQVIINEDGVTPTPLPALVQRNISALKDVYPNAKHFLLNDTDIRDFLRANFSDQVYRAYDGLLPYAYKADLARYCLLFVRGGLYCDLGVRFLDALTAPNWAAFVAFRDVFTSSTRSLCVQNGLILAAPGRPELKTAIDIVVGNCERLYYGANALDPTGPAVLGRAIAANNADSACLFGDFREVSPELPGRKNPVYLTPEGIIVALGKTLSGGDLTGFGLSGVNNYNDFWNARRVYGEEGMTRWRFDAPQIQSQVGLLTPAGIAFDHTSRGCVIYGPYTSVVAGKYDVVMTFGPGADLDGATIDVVASGGKETITELSQGELVLDPAGRLNFRFTAKTPLSQVEVRLHVNGSSRGRFESLEFHRS